MSPIEDWFNARLLGPAKTMSRLQLLWALLIGVLGGVFPIPMLTTGAVIVLALFFGFSTAQTTIATAVNLLVTPLQFLLIIPFARIAAIFSASDFSQFSPSLIRETISERGVTSFVFTMSSLFIHAVTTWSLVVIFVVVLLIGIERLIM